MTSPVYFRLERALAGRSSRKVAVATTIRRIDGGGIALRYHATDVVTVRDGVVTLNSGGWRTATTKRRINAYLPDGWSVFQRDSVWFYSSPLDSLLFADGITFPDTDEPAPSKVRSPYPCLDLKMADTGAPLGWGTVGTVTT